MQLSYIYLQDIVMRQKLVETLLYASDEVVVLEMSWRKLRDEPWQFFREATGIA